MSTALNQALANLANHSDVGSATFRVLKRAVEALALEHQALGAIVERQDHRLITLETWSSAQTVEEPLAPRRTQGALTAAEWAESAALLRQQREHHEQQRRQEKLAQQTGDALKRAEKAEQLARDFNEQCERQGEALLRFQEQTEQLRKMLGIAEDADLLEEAEQRGGRAQLADELAQLLAPHVLWGEQLREALPRILRIYTAAQPLLSEAKR